MQCAFAVAFAAASPRRQGAIPGALLAPKAPTPPVAAKKKSPPRLLKQKTLWVPAMQSPVEIRAKGQRAEPMAVQLLHEVVLKQLPPEAPESSAQEGSREGARAFFQQRIVDDCSLHYRLVLTCLDLRV